MKVLVATEKPFAAEAVTEIKAVFADAGYELKLLEKYTERQDLLNAAVDVDAMIIRSDKIKTDVFDAAKELKIIVRAGAGYDNVDCDAATSADVVVMNTPGQNSNAVAELALGMMLYIARNGFTPKSGRELRGKTLGIHAYGNVGKYVAAAAAGFGMKIKAFDPFVSAEKMKADGVDAVASAEELYSQCDYISLHLPKMKETLGSVGYEFLSKMKKGACLVNTARKEVVDEDGLLRAFKERDDLKYVSDVAPVCAAQMEEDFAGRVFFTPKKMGAQTLEANVNAGVAAARQIVAYLEKGDTTFRVNK